MKSATALLSALAPLALAKAVHNHYPGEKRTMPVFNNGLSGYGLTTDARTEVIIIWVNQGGGAAPVYVNDQVTVTQTVTAGLPAATPGMAEAGTPVAAPAAGTTHEVTVGGPGGLVFTPDNIQASVGDMVIFSFLGQNHTATQSAFDTPCDLLAGGMDSGFQPNPDNTVVPAPQVAMQVMVDTPLWFFCSQSGHCGKGMTFSINPTADKSQAMFQAMAIQQNGTGANSAITGGEGAPAQAAPAPADSSAPALSSLPPLATGGTGTVVQPTPVVDPNIVQGTGTVQPDGSCACAVAVGAGSFPAVAQQGVGNFGGMPGSLPAEMVEAI